MPKGVQVQILFRAPKRCEMNELEYPKNATDEEKKIDWQKIAEISDEDFGFDSPKEKTGKIRFDVRILLLNDKNEICVIKSRKHGFLQMPGGGIEDGESIIEALERETEEETGWLISDIEPIGYVLQKREDIRNRLDFDCDISYVFKASPKEQIKTNYMDDEIEEGFMPIWIDLDNFILEQEKNEGKIENYGGCFSNRRDILVSKYFKKILNSKI